MKRLSVFVFAMLLAGSLSFAQNTAGDAGKKADTKTASTDTGKKGHKKKGHKGGKKSKKSSSDTATPSK